MKLDNDDELHQVAPEDSGGSEGGAASEATPAQLRARKSAETRKAKAKAREERQRRAAERRAAKADIEAEPTKKSDEPKAEGGASAAYDDDEWSRWVQEEMEKPLQGPRDLALVLGKLQMMAVGLAADTAYQDAAWSLQWTDGKNPLPRCEIASRMLWPWMKKNGLDGTTLAEQAEGVLALIGVAVLLGPSIGPVRDAMKKAKAERQAKEEQAARAENRTIGAELVPPNAPKGGP